MNPQEIINFTQKIDIKLSVINGKLIINAPKGCLTDQIKCELKADKTTVLKLLGPKVQPKRAIIYTAIVYGKELTLIDIHSKPADEFKRGGLVGFLLIEMAG